MLLATGLLSFLVASAAEPAAVATDPRRVRLELAVGGLWQSEYDDDYGGLARRGPGIDARATFRLGRHLALIRGEDPWPDYDEKTTSVVLTGSFLWHFRSSQPVRGSGDESGGRGIWRGLTLQATGAERSAIHSRVA